MAGGDLTMNASAAELDDIQGLLHSGYKDLSAARFMLLRIASPTAAKAWLATAPVTNASREHRHSETLHVAVTAPGLRRLGLQADALAGFSSEFLAGMTGEAARSRRLGDVGADTPENWSWGWAETVPDLMVMIYARPDGLAAWRSTIATADFTAGFSVLAELETTDMGGREPFGFADGLSQPALDWDGRRHPPSDDDLEYGNLIALGEFVLGYDNEYGFRTERPLLPPAADPKGMLPPAPESDGQHDLGRNGSYLVLRQLDQDVRGLWRFLSAQATPDGAVELAETMVGRHMSGEPLLPASPAAIRGVGRNAEDRRLNQFTFDSDPNGLRCPVGAHIRRANPRNGDMPGGRQGPIHQLLRLLGLVREAPASDVIASSRFHRILRRGRPYGSFIDKTKALTPDNAPSSSGLYFICLNANIARQFEFVQSAWLQSPKFGGLESERDPLIGNRQPRADGAATDSFAMPTDGPTRCIAGIPSFVKMQGGAYFFLPGLRALRFLATLP
jgi:Dyp-type peroxidase family